MQSRKEGLIVKHLITGNLDEEMVQVPLPHITEWESVEESGYLAYDEAGIVTRNEDEDTWLYILDWDRAEPVVIEAEPEESLSSFFGGDLDPRLTDFQSLLGLENSSDTSVNGYGNLN